MSQPSLPPEEPAPAGSRVAARLLEQPLRNLGVGVTAVVLGTTAAFGGLEEARPSTTQEVKVGTTMTADPFEITVKRLLWVNELPGYPTNDEGNRWLAIVADVTNTGDETLLPYLAGEAITVNGVEGLTKTPEPDLTTTRDLDDRTDRVSSDRLVHFPDSTLLNPLQPGLTYQAVYLYEQKGSADAAAEVSVQLVGHTLRPNAFDQVEMWLDPTVIAESRLPVLPPEDTSEPADSLDTVAAGEGAAG
ncbi:hypothetical protein [Kineosporia babensis]|uniref:Uncharacterized protein n=1 Tax=Kineosporia babensis TaxID=499548 RepID=A0A9X1SUG8_9ACTN|nr:hypothetical protein [Kineosporia babensis]MCD5311695.1 hypothetical protein [Kineosporia babensis]